MASPRTRWLHAAVAAAAVAPLLATASCGSACGGFALSLAVDSGGQASPEAAATAFAAHGTAEVSGLPHDGWRRTGTDAAGVGLRSGRSTLHAVQGSDGSWFVDSGSAC